MSQVSIHSLVPDADELLGLSVEELSWVVLRALQSRVGHIHYDNFSGDVGSYPRDRAEQIQKAIKEAWTWLQTNGLIAIDPEPGYFVTKRGRDTNTEKKFKELHSDRRALDLPRQVFENIFWPAAAGNVFWTFCSLLMYPTASVIGVLPRLAFLLLLSTYLTVGWIRLVGEPRNIGRAYWIGEFFHLVVIAFCAISAQVQPDYLPLSLGVYFVGMAIGHWNKAWELPPQDPYPRVPLVIVHVIGLAILLFGVYGANVFGLRDITQSHDGSWFSLNYPIVINPTCCVEELWWEEWTIPASYGVPLVLWALIRRHSLKQIGRSAGLWR